MTVACRVLALIAIVFLSACDSRAAREAEQMSRFPGGDIVTDCEPAPPAYGRGLPDCLRAPAAVLGRGVCVRVEPRRADGAWNTPRWGVWTYEYVPVTQGVNPATGAPTTHFPTIDESTGIESQGEYASDKSIGTWKFWHLNGKQRALGGFVDNKMSGEWKFWNADGSLDALNSGTYVNGVRTSGSK